MTALGQRTLIQHLVDPESLETLAREGLDEEVVPSEELRKIYTFSIDYFHHSGRTKAPSVGVLMAEYGELLSDHEIDINEDPEDSIEWAIDDLKGTYVYKETASLNKRLAAAMSGAETGDRVGVLAEFATEMVALSMQLENRESKVDVRVGAADRMLAYEARAADRGLLYGLRMGIEAGTARGPLSIDNYTRGVHDGELAVLAAGPKVGKSYFLNRVAVKEQRAGRVTVLFTLENSVEMTLDRMACLATMVDSRKWQHGECDENEVALIRGWVEEMTSSDTALHVIQPPPGTRSVETMVRQAQLLDADSLLIDQLTFIEPTDERAPRHLQIRQITHDLKSMISTGRGRMPCLLAHQINREGVKAADKAGRLEMFHLAEGSEVERTADWVFGLYRSQAEAALNRAKFQTLASRREETRDFILNWNVNSGLISPITEINYEGSPIHRDENGRVAA